MRAGVCACALSLFVAVAPASAISQRRVTLAVSGSGKAFWKLDGKGETAHLALRYRWFGTIRFDVSTGGRLSATRAATLTAGWSGTYTDKVGRGVLITCTYAGAHVRSAVTAKLAHGRKANTLELTFHPGGGHGFFAAGGSECEGGTGPSTPPHFPPFSFFRDGTQDHGRLTTDTAILVLPSTLLTRGKAAIAFPSEQGRNDSPALGHLGWDNRGTATIAVR